MERTGDLDAYFAKMMKDSIFRQAYAVEENKMASALTLLKARGEIWRSKGNDCPDRDVDKTC
ncbi:hypothetical protein LT104_03635 [Lacticaseibacillus zeae]|nr:hypothetical protein [Lacticaseibacillus zeae]MDE3314992.1 hypothetical protein [Lacticaseibacillus zeae]